MEKLLFKVDGSKWKNLNDFSINDIKNMIFRKITIKNKTKINLNNISITNTNKLLLLERKNNEKYLKKYNHYYYYYKHSLNNDLKYFKLFNISQSSKLKNMLILNFNSAFNCNNAFCTNFLRCYSKKVERCRPNIIKMVARQAAIFNSLSTEELEEKIKRELIDYYKHNYTTYKNIRLCQYGSISQKQFNKLLDVLNRLYDFLKYNNISFYIYMDHVNHIKKEYHYLINDILFINSSNFLVKKEYEINNIKTNEIINVDKVFFEELQNQKTQNFNFCYGNCTVCNYCMHYQEKPILFKNH